MDFIERIFGIAPDGGDGTFEFMLFAVPLIGLVLLWRQRQARRRHRESEKSRR